MTVPKRCRSAPSRNKLAGRSCMQFFRTLARFCSSKRHSAETMCRKHNLLSVSLADLDSCSTLSGHRQHCIACETHTAALIDCQQRVRQIEKKPERSDEGERRDTGSDQNNDKDHGGPPATLMAPLVMNWPREEERGPTWDRKRCSRCQLQ